MYPLSLSVASLKNMANLSTGETGEGWTQRDARRERTKGGIYGNNASGFVDFLFNYDV